MRIQQIINDGEYSTAIVAYTAKSSQLNRGTSVSAVPLTDTLKLIQRKTQGTDLVVS